MLTTVCKPFSLHATWFLELTLFSQLRVNWNQIKWCQKHCSVQLFSDALCNIAMAHAGEELCPGDLQELRLLTLLLVQLLPSAKLRRFLLHAVTPCSPVWVFFLLLSNSFFISPMVCSALPAVVLATGTVWSCVRAGRVVTRCQSPSAPRTAGPPPECAVTCSAALPLSGWQVPGER